MHSKVCGQCGRFCHALLPAHFSAPKQFGASVGVVVSYLSVYQWVPHDRMSVLLKDIFGLSISKGSIDNLLERSAQQALPVYHAIQQKIQQSKVVGSDETGARFEGKKRWFHAWQTNCLTFIVASLNSGNKTINQYLADAFVCMWE